MKERIRELEQGLKIILTWASVTKEPEYQHEAVKTLEMIERKCKELLKK